MTRKDYVLLAAIVAKVPAQGCGPEWLAGMLADVLEDDNPRFDRARFIAACHAEQVRA